MSRRFRSTLSAVVLVLAGCAPAPQWRPVPAGVPDVRVLLREGTATVVGADGLFRIAPLDPASTSSVLPADEILDVEWVGAGRVRVRDRATGSPSEHTLPLRIEGVAPGTLVRIDGNPYRGVVELRSGERGLLVVNRVDVESYLRGVVPAEISCGKEDLLEAVKAQAVAARTYALKRLGKGASPDYDLLATVADQVYKGRAGEAPLGDRAVRETEGIVLVHRGRLIDAYYGACCGGRTASIRDVWEREDAEYLRGVWDRPAGTSGPGAAYCRHAARFEWTVTWDGEELHKILSRSIPAVLGKAVEVGEIQDVRVRGTYRCGRVKTLEVRTKTGTYRVHGDKARWILRQPGNDQPLWSARFDLSVRRSGGRVRELTASGAGYGHGLGMCQEGAIGMARAGRRFDEILEHYYPGTHLQRTLYDSVP